MAGFTKLSPLFHELLPEQVLCTARLKTANNADFMSALDNMSNQPALLGAKSLANDGNGFWYRKAPKNNIAPVKSILEKSESAHKPAASNANEIRDSLFHFNCGCSKCKDFEFSKSNYKKNCERFKY